MEKIKVWTGTSYISLSKEELNKRLGVDITTLYNPITEIDSYVYINRKKIEKTNNRFTKKNIKSKLERINDDDLEELLLQNECSFDELVSKIYQTNYRPSTKSNYDVPGVRLANHKNVANYGENQTTVYANLVFDNK